MKYAFSIAAQREDDSGTKINHVPGLLEANSDDEAYGKAYQIALKAYPIKLGWMNHSVGVHTNGTIITVDNVIQLCQEK